MIYKGAPQLELKEFFLNFINMEYTSIMVDIPERHITHSF